MNNRPFEPEKQDLITELRSDLLEWLITTKRPKTVHGVNSGILPEGKQYIQRNGTAVNADGKIATSLLSDAIYGKNYL
ncbi:MAG: hypothetical protein RLP44_17505 [Aggregatilineales bacterium]